jgi:hypothetical protein
MNNSDDKQQNETDQCAMNYAEDRLDRKSRGTDLLNDFQLALRQNDHGLLGRTLRDVGWIRHAVFHYSQCQGPNSIGDYAQMAELAGFPEIGILALLRFRNHGEIPASCEAQVDFQPTASTQNPSWLRQEAPTGHCGCGLEKCGQSLCEVTTIQMDPVLKDLESYVECLPMRTMPTAHEILGATSQSKAPTCSDNIPDLLQFWKTDSAEFTSLSPALQLLLTKQLYLVMPTLAAEAVAQVQFDQRQMAIDFKSHNAYHVLIQAVVLGERIKPHRRMAMADYHVPAWDILWGHDGRHGQTRPLRPAADDIVEHFRNCLRECQTSSSIPKLLVVKSENKPLYVVGDSHVLSTAWQTIQLPDGSYRTLTPVVVTGLKAWHCRPQTRFFTFSLLNILLRRLPPTDCILFSAGEIDCREGLGGPELQGYSTFDKSHVQQTVVEFVKSLMALQVRMDIWVLPVCPHVHRSDRNGKAVGRAARRQVTQLWNEQLRSALPDGRIRVLDYENALLGNTGYVLKRAYNADGTHMNSAFLSHLEEALKTSQPNNRCALNSS